MDLDLSLLPQAAAQMRGALSNLYFAAARLAPASAREQDPELDAKAALVDQSYYRLIRLVNNLSATRYLNGAPLPQRDRTLMTWIKREPSSWLLRPQMPRPKPLFICVGTQAYRWGQLLVSTLTSFDILLSLLESSM